VAATAARSKQARKGTRKRPPVRMLSRAQVPGAVATMAAPTGTARFAAGKTLAVTAGKDPARVYPYFDAIAGLLESGSKVVRWNAMQVIARLAAADTGRKLDGILDAYLGFISAGNLISAANAIQGAGKIGQHRPDLVNRIVPAILEVERATYETAECRNVAIGHALEAFQELGPSVCRRPEVAGFIRRQMRNTRAAVARCAEGVAAEFKLGA
jgi:hypothetical protein